MPATVRLPTIIRAHAGGESRVEAQGATIGEIVEDLVTRYPGMAANLKGDDGGLHRFVNLYVNDEDIRYTGGLDTPVNDGDEISILPAVAGG